MEVSSVLSWQNPLSAFNNNTKKLINDCINTSIPPPINLSALIEKSHNFPVEFPINTVKSDWLKKQNIPINILESNANSVYPIIHEAMLPLISAWLKYKRENGSHVEKALYKNMNLIKFIQRLLDNRSISFWGRNDRWLLINNRKGTNGWENVGTDRERSPLILAKCLSYDEMKLSAMMVVSSYSEFINDGSRHNKGIPCENRNDIQPRGVIMGVVAPRFQRLHVMEYEDMVLTPEQNTVANGYGKWVENASPLRPLRVIWSKFYGQEYYPLFEDALATRNSSTRKCIYIRNKVLFDIENYMKRTLLTVEIILLEANARAQKQNTTAYLYVVGFGLGKWKILKDQNIHFLKTWKLALSKMHTKLKHISDIMFSYILEKESGNAENPDYIGDIRIHYANREPHSKLIGPVDSKKLLVVTYAWDGNAHPGNEFWSGHLDGSGDSAAACSTQITELHNSHINSRACGANLHIASPEHGLIHISDYAKLQLAETNK